MEPRTVDISKVVTPYNSIRKAIQLLVTVDGAQLSLEDLATSVNLSPHHFQRLFVEWAGVSPKEFAQSIRAKAAKEMLKIKPVLESSIDLGMSSPSRLHELMLRTEAMTPGDVRARGEGVSIAWSINETVFGPAFFGVTRLGLCRLTFVDSTSRPLEEAQAAWPMAAFNESPDATEPFVAEISRRMAGLSPKATLGVVMRGSSFRLKVWEALMNVPQGRVISYGDLAVFAGAPMATRAVASAVASNELAYLIPCHRVIRSSGALGEYRWGSSLKASIVGYEQSHAK